MSTFSIPPHIGISNPLIFTHTPHPTDNPGGSTAQALNHPGKIHTIISTLPLAKILTHLVASPIIDYPSTVVYPSELCNLGLGLCNGIWEERRRARASWFIVARKWSKWVEGGGEINFWRARSVATDVLRRRIEALFCSREFRCVWYLVQLPLAPGRTTMKSDVASMYGTVSLLMNHKTSRFKPNKSAKL